METIRPIARGDRMLTERGRELILRRRRQNARDDRGRDRHNFRLSGEAYGLKGAALEVYVADVSARRGIPIFTPFPGLRTPAGRKRHAAAVKAMQS